ncbi:MAG: Crp/Fnr family transcriptional regulator [Bacteroidales bacterium]|nr:Crp/Fnr family transcriptional regulator [Bacteroidales bacterium]
MEASELKKLPLFEQCNHDDLVHLLNKPHKRQEYAAESLVMRLGDPCLSLMAITEGTVEVRMGSDEGREIVVEHVSAPRLLAPMFLYAEDNTLLVEMHTTADTVIWFINREAFFDFMHQHPHIMSAFILAVSEQARFLAGKVRSFATKSLQGRVLEHLDAHDTITNIALVAEMLGVARPSLSRVLAEMQADGHIIRTKDGIVRR